MLGQIPERVLATLCRISAYIRDTHSDTPLADDVHCTSVFLHGGEVDSLEGKVALSGVH